MFALLGEDVKFNDHSRPKDPANTILKVRSLEIVPFFVFVMYCIHGACWNVSRIIDYVCSAQCRNLRNPKIVQRKVGIHACFGAKSQDCVPKFKECARVCRDKCQFPIMVRQ